MKGVVRRFQDLLAKHSLPDLSTLLSNTPSPNVWKLQLLKLAPHWAAMVGDVKMTRLNNFRIHLLVGCDGLERDASRFRTGNTSGIVHDPSCKLCSALVEV